MDKSKYVLLLFLKDYLAWSKKWFVTDKFYKYAGLCVNWELYAPNYNLNTKEKRILEGLFFEDGLDKHHPFGMERYESYKRKGKLHRDPTRIQWVKGTIIKLELQLQISE